MLFAMVASDEDHVLTRVHRVGESGGGTPLAFVLEIVEGPDKGQIHRLDLSLAFRALVGTSPACSVRLTDNEVSRRHLALEVVAGRLRVSDLGSTNGTWVDRLRVRDAELEGGESLRLGQTVLRVVLEHATPAAPVAVASTATRFGRVVGASDAMRRLYPLCERLAATSVPVVIEGETGTGKEVLAESLHEMGPRAEGPFVVFDCTAVPPNLVEAELFGYERGAFTGAVQGRRGLFEQADTGTLLIDEIGDLELPLQAKLLRAIERSEIRRIGGERWLRADVRILAATRRDLDREVQAGRFRDDLFHRLAVVRIELPPLRHRTGDIGRLALHLWREMGGDPLGLPRALLQRWEDYPWPGNVRELRNTIARQLAVGDLSNVQHEYAAASSEVVPPPTASSGTRDAIDRFVNMDLSFPQARDRILEEFETRYVTRLLERHGGDVAKAAAASGIGRRYFQKLKARRK
jgi:DNA-binding NtrC family response regulator